MDKPFDRYEFLKQPILGNKMKVREALILQSPSLALQRAALDEIAILDAEIALLKETVEELKKELYIKESNKVPAILKKGD